MESYVKEEKTNLKLLNNVRIIAQTVKNDSFRREYMAIIEPILEKYKYNICSDDDMLWKIYEAIKKINHLANTYMYVPNTSGSETGYGKIQKADYSDHGKLMEVFVFTNKIIKEKKIN